MKYTMIFRNAVGAFSDAAVLFPLLAVLCSKAGFSASVLLLTTGLVYIVSSIVFKIPMSVQPLKSIAVAAVTVGATYSEVRMSGFLLGVFFLILSLTQVERWARRVPEVIIHQLQLGVGVLLILQATKSMGNGSGSFPGSFQGFQSAVILLTTAVVVFFPEIKKIPVLGVFATVGMVLATLFPEASAGVPVNAATSQELIRPAMIAGLLIPQLVLTSANSVLATQNVCHRYFGEQARLVTIPRLLKSIGLGNIAVSILGGMPFCHGSGGVTAHVRGGSSHPGSTAAFGALLLVLSLVHFKSSMPLIAYPSEMVAVLLLATGIFHIKLAGPTAKHLIGWAKLITAAGVVLLTRNLLWVLAAALGFECAERFLSRRIHRSSSLGVLVPSSTEGKGVQS